MITYNELLTDRNGERIRYSELLEVKEWKEKRKIIISRQNHVCQKCNGRCINHYVLEYSYGYVPVITEIIEETYEVEIPITWTDIYVVVEAPNVYEKITYPNKPLFPHVHHTYYVDKALPWAYPDESLMLVCHSCHLEIHQKEVIKVYTNFNRVTNLNLTACNRCGGAGHFPQYNHVENGVCFKCQGARFLEWI